VPQGVDTSIYGTLGQGAGQNPLAMISQFAGAQNALNQNALFQQTFRARQAMGPLMQQATDPQSGQVDWDKAATLVATHPDTSFLAPEFLNNIAQKKLLDAETTNQKLEATGKRMDMMAGIYSAAAKDPNVNSMADMGSYMSQAMSIGAIDPSKYKETIAFLADPKYANLKGPDFRNQVLLPHAIAMQRGSSSLTALTQQFDPALGFDPATGQNIPGWKNNVYGTAQPILPGGAQPNTGGPTAPQPGGPAAAPAVAAPPAGPTPSVPGGDPFSPGPPAQARPAAPSAGPAAPQQQPANFQYGQPGPAQQKKLEDIESMRSGYNNTAAHAAALQQVADQLQTALQKVKAGAGASAYQEAAKLLQSLGVSNDTVDKVANGSLPAGQTAETLATQLGTMAVRQLLLSQTGGEGSAGRLTNLEFGKIVDIFPNIDNDPRAATAIFNFIRRQNTIANAKATGFNSVYNAYHAHQPLPGGMQDPTQFEPYFTQKLVDKGLITQGIARNILNPEAK
jgi:hypothetical protein